MDSNAYIDLGANLGKRRRTFEQAIGTLIEAFAVELTACSGLYETAAVGGPADQPEYLNAAIAIRTPLAARDLLDALLQIELDFGRERRIRDGPRTLDLDLLLYGDVIVEHKALQLPHPRMHLRRFVLQPMCDIAPQLVHPRLGSTLQSLLSQLRNDQQVSLRAGPEWIAGFIGGLSSTC